MSHSGGLSPCRRGFDASLVHVGFFVTQGQLLITQVFQFYNLPVHRSGTFNV